MIYLLLSILLFVIPFGVWNGYGDSIRFPKEFLSILGFMSVIGLTVLNYRLKPFKNKWLPLFWGWCIFITFIFSYTIPIQLKNVIIDMPSILFSWKELFYISLSIFTIYCLTSYVPKIDVMQFSSVGISFKDPDTEGLTRGLSRVITICALIMSIYSIIQYVGIDEWFRIADMNTGWVGVHPLDPNVGQRGDTCRRIVGTLGNPSLLAIWFAICIPFMLYLKNKLGYITLLLSILVMLMTKCTTGLVGASVGVFIYLFFIRRKLLYIFLALLIPIGLICYTHHPTRNHIISTVREFSNGTGRMSVHKESWNILREKALTGMGLGTFEYMIGNNEKIVKRLNNESWKELHNEFGQLWWSTGLIGLGLFLMFILTTMSQFLRNITDESVVLFSSLSAFLVMSISYFNFRVSPISFYGVILCGLFLNTIYKGEC